MLVEDRRASLINTELAVSTTATAFPLTVTASRVIIRPRSLAADISIRVAVGYGSSPSNPALPSSASTNSNEYMISAGDILDLRADGITHLSIIASAAITVVIQAF